MTGSLALDYEATLGYTRNCVLSDTGLGSSRREAPQARETLSGFMWPRWLKPVVNGLVQLSNLPSDWDSYGAQRIDAWHISSAYQILATVMHDDTPAPSIVPTSDGHIQFEWHRQGIDLEVEVISPTRVAVLYEDQRSGNEPTECILSYDLEPLRKCIRDLTREI